MAGMHSGRAQSLESEPHGLVHSFAMCLPSDQDTVLFYPGLNTMANRSRLLDGGPSEAIDLLNICHSPQCNFWKRCVGGSDFSTRSGWPHVVTQKFFIRRNRLHTQRTSSLSECGNRDQLETSAVDFGGLGWCR